MDRTQTLETIRAHFKAETSYIADPHTAVGLSAARTIAATKYVICKPC